jgi:hypothetical protein
VRRIPLLAAVVGVLAFGRVAAAAEPAAPEGRWTEERAKKWAAGLPWLVGCNFIPSNAINQLEMWQSETFDPEILRRELDFASQLGFTSVRVYLHHIPWQQDAAGFGRRIDQFLRLAEGFKIGVMFVLFDSCWDPFPKPGPQRAPTRGVHNSGWVQCPGLEILKDPARHDELKGFVTGVIGRFREDKRILVWDLFNEPENRNDASYGKDEPPNKRDLAFALLKKAYAWAREAKPAQPVTSGIWAGGDWSNPDRFSPLQRFQIESSDVVSFHCYGRLDELRAKVEALRQYKRPLLCTEFLARPRGSTFQAVLPYLKEQRVGAYCWGLVAGKTQTIYPWESWKKPFTAEPPVWHHDIVRQNGLPFDEEEMRFIQKVTGVQR